MSSGTDLLVVNAGSSSLKLTVLRDEEVLHDQTVEDWDGSADPVADAARRHPVSGVGHRVVHGGADFTDAVVVDDEVRRRLQALTSLAPLHQPRALAGIDAARAALPSVPSVACFDTAFHAGIPSAASMYAVPRAWRERWAVRRYGAHGLSHAHAVRRAGELVGRPLGRVVSCHLGSGASLAAVRDGQCVDTTMGFTPLEGLVMATRSGTVDPGLVLWLIREAGLSPDQVAAGLEQHGGLLAMAGTKDMEQVITRASDGDRDASMALEVYLHRLRRELGAMVGVLGGLDCVVFTGGVGEHAAPVRAGTLEGLRHLGVVVDDDANRAGRGDRVISAAKSRLIAIVVSAREDLEIGRQCRALLAQP